MSGVKENVTSASSQGHSPKIKILRQLRGLGRKKVKILRAGPQLHFLGIAKLNKHRGIDKVFRECSRTPGNRSLKVEVVVERILQSKIIKFH